MRYADTNCTYTEEYEPEHIYVFRGPCVVTSEIIEVRVKGSELFEYRNGAYAQEAFKSLYPDQIEFLISGISAEGWALTFG